jgi:Fur family peroxide stress response transcriptional regulator
MNVRQMEKKFIDFCNHHSLRATPQRVEVYKAVCRSSDHPSAEQVCEIVRKRMPSISLDTVYRSLAWLEENGQIFQVGGLGNSARYDGNLSPHLHFKCSKCGELGDIFMESFPVLSVSDYLPEDFTINRFSIEVRGICSNCK